MITDWSKNEWKEFARGLLFVVGSFAFFFILQFIVRWYLFGKCTFRTFSYFRRRRGTINEDSTTLSVIPRNKKWRICNEAVSLIHAAVSGLWAAYSILVYRDVINDMIFYRHPVIVTLILVSTGYLIHDLIDLLINERSIRIIELLFHHVVVLTAFATTMLTEKFLGVVIFGLLMELNSIFLHSRSLMNLYGVEKKSPPFRMVALVNMVTLIIFRMAVSLYLFYWMWFVCFGMEWHLFLPSFFVITSLLVTNTVLAFRVMAADGLLGKKRARGGPQGEQTVEDGVEDVEKSSSDDEEEEEEEVEVAVHTPNEQTQQLVNNTTTTATNGGPTTNGAVNGGNSNGNPIV